MARVIKFSKEREFDDSVGYMELRGGKTISLQDGACIGVIALRKHIFDGAMPPRVITITIE